MGAARLVQVGDELQPRIPRLFGLGIEADKRARKIVEQHIETIVEQRQPMFHALVLTTGGDRLVKRIVARHRAEQLHVTLAKLAPHLRPQRKLAHRQKLN